VFIDEFKQVFGVEPICRVLTGHGLKIATSTYYAAKSRPPSARSLRDAERLMRRLGLEGARRGKKIRTIQRNDGHQRAADIPPAEHEALYAQHQPQPVAGVSP